MGILKKYAEKLHRPPAEVAAEISGMELEQFQNELRNESGLGEVLSGQNGKRLAQAKAFFTGFQSLRMSVANDLQKIKTGQMTWGNFIKAVTPKLEASADSVDKSATFGDDAMNSLAKIINKAQKPLKNKLYQELVSLQNLINESPYSPVKLGDLAVAYSKAEESLQRYDDDDLRSPYDPRPVDPEQDISEMNVAEGNLNPYIRQLA